MCASYACCCSSVSAFFPRCPSRISRKVSSTSFCGGSMRFPTCLLGAAAAFARQALQMHASRLFSTGLFSATARATELRPRFDVAFSDLIPPFLLGSAPDLRRAATGTRKRSVFIVTACDKARRPVAVVRGERFHGHPHQAGWSRCSAMVLPLELTLLAA
ncbi:MAG: hypothetical protein K0R53_3010 [Burkholderiales bacterium]|nr:hypothetical protein [Burkholderiales bacterium]